MLRRYILHHGLLIAAAAVAGVGIAFIISGLPALRRLGSVAPQLSVDLRIGVAILSAVVLAGLWSFAVEAWRRYRRTYALANPPLIFADLLATFCATASVTLLLLHRSYDFTEQPLNTSIALGFLLFAFASDVASRRQASSVAPEQGRQKDGSSDSDQSVDYPDDAIISDDADMLGRVPFAENLYQQILNLPFRNSFVFGLQGKWGEGKTSVFNLLRRRLEQTQSIILVEFNPWYWTGENSLIDAFYAALERAIRQHYIASRLHATVRKYLHILTVGTQRHGVKIGISIPDNPQNVRDELERWIERTGCRIVVLVDDVDRLNAADALGVFKVAGLSARIRNVVFVLGFDPVVLRRNLEQHLQIDETYLEKVVQKSLHLPSLEQRDIDQFLLFSDAGRLSAIDRLFKDLSVPKVRIDEFDREFVSLYRRQLWRLFPTLRHAKRFMNGLRTGLSAVANDVNLYDFVLLESVRMHCPELYDDIWWRRTYYLPAWSLEFQLTLPLDANASGDEKKRSFVSISGRCLQERSTRILCARFSRNCFPLQSLRRPVQRGSDVTPERRHAGKGSV